jgi:hypothetical protein
MNVNTFVDENGDEIDSYNVVNPTIELLLEIINDISGKDDISLGYMVRHSKFKGISYSSDDEYVDQFIELHVPSSKKKSMKKKKEESGKKNNKKDNEKNDEENDEENNIESEEEKEDDTVESDEVVEEDIHEFSFDAKYKIDETSAMLFIYDPGMGNRINLNSILNLLNILASETNKYNNYIVAYRNDHIVCYINEIWVCSAKKSIKFY